MKSVLVAVNFKTSQTMTEFFEGEYCKALADRTQSAWREKFDNDWTYRVVHDAEAAFGPVKRLPDNHRARVDKRRGYAVE